MVFRVLCEVRTLGGSVWYPIIVEWCQVLWGCVMLVAGLVVSGVEDECQA